MFFIDRDKTAVEIGKFFADCHPSLPGIGISVINLLHKQPELWVSVNDGLPKSNTRCIVYYVHSYCDNDGYYAIDTSFYNGEKFDVHSTYKVTHWMPTPEPPIGFQGAYTE